MGTDVEHPAAPVRRTLSLLLVFAFPALAAAQPCVEEAGTVGELVDAVNAAAGEPDEAGAAFFAAFATAFGESGRATKAAIDALVDAAGDRPGAVRAASLVKHDRELDEDEVRAAAEALSTLGRIPDGVAKALGNALPAANAAVADYAVHLDLCGTGPTFGASATIRLEAKAPAPLILEADPERLTIESVKAAGREVPFKTENGRLVVDARGAKKIDVAYRVKTTADPAGYGLIRDSANGRFFTMTWPYRTGALFPSNPDPSDGVTSKISAKTCGDMTFIGSGHDDGRGNFVSRTPSPAYSIAGYAASDFARGRPVLTEHGPVTGYGSGTVVSEETRARYRKTAGAALDFYSTWLGGYEYGDGLSVVEVASGGLGGMEHVSAVAIMLDSARHPEDAEETAAHEVAHHWFGDNLRIASWPEFWMSEGFTDYSTWRYFREAEGEEKYRRLLKTGRAAVKSQLAHEPHALRPADATDINEFFDSIPYAMGAWMLRMIEVKVGTERFDEMLRGWYRENRFTPVSTKQFLDYASKKTGEDLHAFFDGWNSIRALPQLDGNVAFRGSQVEASLAVRNTLPAGTMIPLTVYGANGATKTVMVDPAKPASFDAGFEVVKTAWDADVTVLAEVRSHVNVATGPQ